MKISDTQLNGFLDNELSATEMEQVRVAIETDDELVLKLAELTQVDDWVCQHAQQIDHTPVPDRLLALAKQLDQRHVPHSDNVVSIASWAKSNLRLSSPLSMAASVALVFVLGTVTFNQTQDEIGRDVASLQVAEVLNTQVSGESVALTSTVTIKPQLSFINQQGQFCRQYSAQDEAQMVTAIACKNDTQWQISAQHAAPVQASQGAYQVASGPQELEAALDTMMSGAPLDRNQEKQAIERQWHSQQQ